MLWLSHVVIILIGNASWTDGFDQPGTYPSWDALSQQGVQMSEWVSNPIGSQSNYALLFGRYPFRNGNTSGFSFYAVGPPAAELRPTVAHAMRFGGYEAGYFGKLNIGRIPDDLDPLVGDRNGFAAMLHGFTAWNAGIGSNVNSAPGLGNPGTGYADWQRWDAAHDSMSMQWCDEAIGDAWLAWFVPRASEDTFSVVSFQASHGPLSGVPPASTLPPGYVPGPDRESHLMAADFQVGRVLAQLDLSVDHVIMYATTGSGAKSVRDDRILCPAVVAGPGWGVPGNVSRCLSTPRDTWARLATTLGLPGDPGPDAQMPAQYAYCEWQGQRCVRTVDWKLISLPGGAEELYDLNSDASESQPIDPDTYPNQALVAQLRAWMVNP